MRWLRIDIGWLILVVFMLTNGGCFSISIWSFPQYIHLEDDNQVPLSNIAVRVFSVQRIWDNRFRLDDTTVMTDCNGCASVVSNAGLLLYARLQRDGLVYYATYKYGTPYDDLRKSIKCERLPAQFNHYYVMRKLTDFSAREIIFLYDTLLALEDERIIVQFHKDIKALKIQDTR